METIGSEKLHRKLSEQTVSTGLIKHETKLMQRTFDVLSLNLFDGLVVNANRKKLKTLIRRATHCLGYKIVCFKFEEIKILVLVGFRIHQDL